MNSSVDPPLRLAVIGCGFVGQIHARNLHELESVSVAAVCDVETETAEALAWDVGAESYEDPAEFFGKIDLDGVVVATPPHVRREVIGPAAEAGLPVYVEKPPAHTPAEAESCARLLEDAKVPSAVGFMYRVHPLVQRLKDHLDGRRISQVQTLFTLGLEGEIGKAAWHYGFPEDSLNPVLVDACVHNFDVARDLVGDARRVTAAGERGSSGREDSVVVVAEYEQGGLGVHRFSAHGSRRCFGVELIGDGFRFHLDLVGNTLRGERDGDPVEADYDGDVYREAMRAFTDLVAGSKRPTDLLDYAASLSTLSEVRAADRALSSGSWQPVEERP